MVVVIKNLADIIYGMLQHCVARMMAWINVKTPG